MIDYANYYDNAKPYKDSFNFEGFETGIKNVLEYKPEDFPYLTGIGLDLSLFFDYPLTNTDVIESVVVNYLSSFDLVPDSVTVSVVDQKLGIIEIEIISRGQKITVTQGG